MELERDRKKVYLPEYNRRLREEREIRRRLRYAPEADRARLLKELERAREKRKSAVLYLDGEG